MSPADYALKNPAATITRAGDSRCRFVRWPTDETGKPVQILTEGHLKSCKVQASNRISWEFIKGSSRPPNAIANPLKESHQEVELTRNQVRVRREESVDPIFPARRNAVICFPYGS